MTTTKTISTLVMASALFLGAGRANAEGNAQRGQVSVNGPATKVVVAGPVAIHAYSGFSGGTIYAARAVTGTDADCKGQAIDGTTTAIRADSVVDFQVGAGQIACLVTSTDRSFELLWHASKDLPAPTPTMVANSGRTTTTR